MTFRFGETVRRLTGDRRRVTGAETDKGAIEADAVVMSLASYSPRFLKRLGVRVPIYPLKGYSVTIPTEGYNGAPTRAIHDGHRRIVMSRLGDRLRCAGTAELDGHNATIRADRARATLDAAMAVFPSCGDRTKAERWIGFRPMTPDCLPIIGKTQVPGSLPGHRPRQHRLDLLLGLRPDHRGHRLGQGARRRHDRAFRRIAFSVSAV